MTKKRKHGGVRKKLTWQEKLSLVEPEKVTKFINNCNLVCECNCMSRVRQLRQQGHDICTNLRERRLAGDMT